MPVRLKDIAKQVGRSFESNFKNKVFNPIFDSSYSAPPHPPGQYFIVNTYEIRLLGPYLAKSLLMTRFLAA